MKNKKTHALWWKTSEGKYIAQNDRAPLDTSTLALVFDFLGIERMTKGFDKKAIPDIEVIRIVETPLPFEPIHEWMTWTMRGNEISH